MDSSPSLAFKNLGKQYGHHWVFRDISASLHQNDYIALYGNNGAGKTTLLNVLSGLFKSQEGEIDYGGLDVESFCKKFFYFASDILLYDDFSVEENLQYFIAINSIDSKYSKTALEETGLLGHRNKKARHLSSGLRRRLNLACLLVRAPEIVFFDEPFNALDIASQNMVSGIIKNRGLDHFDFKMKAFILVDHNIERCYGLCNKIWLLNQDLIEHQTSKFNLKQVRAALLA